MPLRMSSFDAKLFGAIVVAAVASLSACGSDENGTATDAGTDSKAGSGGSAGSAAGSGGSKASGGTGATGGSGTTGGTGGTSGTGASGGTAGSGGSTGGASGGSAGTSASGGSAGTGGGSGGTAGSGGAPPTSTVVCGTTSCGLPAQYCCAHWNQTPECRTATSDLTTDCVYGVPVTCDGPEDCSGGQVCCAQWFIQGQNRSVVSLMCQSSCTASDQHVVCGASGSCPSGSCVAMLAPLTAYRDCE